MLAWPTMLQNIIGGAQGVVDHALVGHFVGYAGTPLLLGILLTVLNIVCNVTLITGLGPFPKMGTAGAAAGLSIAGGIITLVSIWLLFSGRTPVHWHRGMNWKPDWVIIRQLFRFGLPAGFQGVVMNIGGVLLL